ncbi:hypothetical protein MCEMSHM24_03596 [Comamonadaceae bacterium]
MTSISTLESSTKTHWQNKDAYPPLGCDDRLQLAWEFIRRNRDYAVHAHQMQRLVQAGEFETGINRKSTSVLDGVECWPAAVAGETAKQYFRRMKSEGVKRPRIDKPRNTFVNRWSLLFPVLPDQAYDREVVKFKHYEVKIKRHETLLTRQFHLFLYPNEIAVRFRLDLPIPPQLAMAEKRLEEYRIAYAGELRSQPRSPWDDVGKKQITDEALNRAHYWLRCYDAKHEPKNRSDDPKRKRALKSGPKEQVMHFNKEMRDVGRTDFLETSSLKSFLEQATDYIEKGKYLLLLLPKFKKDLSSRN